MAIDNRVFDNAELLTTDAISTLTQTIERLSETYSTDIAVVTIFDTEGKSSRAYADDFYDYKGLGIGDNCDGVLLLINMQDREADLSTSGYMIDILNDSRIDIILDAQYAYLSDGQYSKAIEVSLTLLEDFLLDGLVAGQYQYTEQKDRINPLSPSWLILSLGIGLVAACVTSLSIRALYKKNYKPTMYNASLNTQFDLIRANDTLINSRTTKQHISASSGGSHSSGSGRSTTHSSSSGRSHGGGTGKKF
jgi:uncharacterized protein